MSLGFLLYYLSDSTSVILIVIANILIGAAMPLYNVNASTIRQGKVDISMLGSVSAILEDFWKRNDTFRSHNRRIYIYSIFCEIFYTNIVYCCFYKYDSMYLFKRIKKI